MNLSWIKRVYLYTVSLISLIILVIAGIILINLILKTWVFPKADSDIYYSPRIVCEEVVDENGSVRVPRDPACDDPNYEAKQAAQDKERRAAQKQRDAAQALAMIIVASPVFYYHWRLARKEA